ncbi:MAG: cysteine--tRNA ligase [bacterium]
MGNIYIHNTETGKLEEFEPQEDDEVKMYACGVTVYDDCHVGHGRAYVVFDTIRRYLEYRGYEVKYVQNFTDIDDKIINRARELEIDFGRLAQEYTGKYFSVMDRLNIKRADVYPSVTGHIDEIIEHVAGLIEKGYAYEVDGDVYFNVDKFEEYGRLSGQDPEEMEEGSRVEAEANKKSPLDFALWKKSGDDEPGWESPWGVGRPGWHIECSVMSQCHLGESLDIHGGGRDLIFPHHENEVAQSEALTGQPLARFWVHNGFVTIDEDKMSKSAGNFYTLEELFEKFDPMVIRYFILSRHYRSPIDFSFDRLEEAAGALGRLQNLYEKLKQAEGWLAGGEESSIAAPELEECRREFFDAMDQDFNSAGALGSIQKWSRQWNEVLAEWEKQERLDRKQQEKISRARRWLQIAAEEILGLNLEKREKTSADSAGIEEELVNLAVNLRDELRENELYELADEVRDKLLETGIELQDTPRGTKWNYKSE